LRTIRGAGDLEKCRINIREKLLLPSTDAPGKYRSEVPLGGRFVATENFIHVVRELKSPLPTNFEETLLAGVEACSMTVAAEAASADAGKPNNCFGLSYQVEFLQALKAEERPGVSVRRMRQVGGADVDWALGAALIQSLQASRQGRAGDSAWGMLESFMWGEGILGGVLAGVGAAAVTWFAYRSLRCLFGTKASNLPRGYLGLSAAAIGKADL
jgi:hypothetical protein